MRRKTVRILLAAAAASAAIAGATLFAQGAPAADADAPTIKVGGLLFADYTYTDKPTSTDADGNTIHPNAFSITRSYLNFTGKIFHDVEYRVTTDINRETGTGSSNNGSYVFRLKYAFGQFDLDDAIGKGSWVKFGLQTTPWIDYDEGIYRYRFQGPTFADTEGYLTSSDPGLSAHYSFPGDYGDVHVGFYNGEGYNHPEANDQKAIQIRAAIRPAPGVDAVRGLRLNAFYDADHYARDDKKQRFLGGLTYESTYVNLGGYYLDAKDQPTAASSEVHGQGYTVWANPKTPAGWEALLRYDSLKPDTSVNARKKRAVAGIAYWFPVHRGVAATVMADYTQVKYDAALNKPDEKRYALHTMFSF